MATPSHPVPTHENTGFPIMRVPLCRLSCKPSSSSWEMPICFRLSSSIHVLTVGSQDLASLSMGPGNIKGTVYLAALSNFPSLSCSVFLAGGYTALLGDQVGRCWSSRQYLQSRSFSACHMALWSKGSFALHFSF